MKPIFSVLLVIYTGSNLITDISVGGDHVGPGAGQGGRRGGAQPHVGPGVGGAGVAPVGNHFGPPGETRSFAAAPPRNICQHPQLKKAVSVCVYVTFKSVSLQ